MRLTDWAENECRIACKKENPNFNFDDEEDFDYGGSCYRSAFKAYKSLMNDGHSGFSFSMTRNILDRLMNSLPLTPIVDEDFFMVERGTEEWPGESSGYLAEHGLKSCLQCPRMTSLFREETLDGVVTYHDVSRSYFIDIDNPTITYTSNDKFLDELFPIKMPYLPQIGKYKIYAQEFLTDKANGDFDTKGILYVITPDGKHIDVNIFKAEIDGKWQEITKEEYIERYNRRIDKTNKLNIENETY